MIVAVAVMAIMVVAAEPALAQTLSLDMGTPKDGSFTNRLIQIIAMMTVLSLAPSLLIMMTSFTRIVVVLSLMRSAIGVQQTPPNTVMVSLALFLTFFIMMPTLQRSYDQGIGPFIQEQISEKEAIDKALVPFKEFMLRQAREKDLGLFAQLAKIEKIDKATDLPIHVIVPAFMISELRRAFEIGFLIFLPFLVIDMVISSILMSMGMMMLPPTVISLPFKLIFFVFIDGWYLISGSLVQSFGTDFAQAIPLTGGGGSAATAVPVTP
jgi:flagellar biosynthetic protein FliP